MERKSIISVMLVATACLILAVLLTSQMFPFPTLTPAPGGTATPAPAVTVAPTATPDPVNEAPTNLNRGDPLPNLTASELAAFLDGKDTFQEQEQAVPNGLGPLFNESSCVNCHNQTVGGGSAFMETRFGRLTNGVFDPLTELGGSLRQLHSIFGIANGCYFPLEVVPPQANVVAQRRTPPLLGLGLVDVLPDQVFINLAASEPVATKGKVQMTLNIVKNQIVVGKFGWKADVPSIFQFSGDAYLNEMGVTNPQFPLEHCPNMPDDCGYMQQCNPQPGLNDDGGDVQAFTDFVKFLAPSPRGPIGSREIAGEQWFNQIGCADCHHTTFTTPNDPSIPTALRNVTFHPYSDFLLHDMGSLGDNIVQGIEKPTEMRTAPLWGTRFNNPFTHDGRASDVRSAIEVHDGQGLGAKNRFNALPSVQQEDLLAFLRSL